MLRLRQLRKEKNITQRELAAQIRCSQKAIDLWEKGETEPKADVVIALANFFECTADYLLGREDDIGNVNVMRDLSENERRILNVYAQLDKKRQDELCSYGEYLLSKL